MARLNEEVEALLREYAELILITGGEAYRARAYEKAARAVGEHPADVSGMDEKDLRAIPNVGTSIAEKITEYVRTGKVAALEEVRSENPPGVRELIAVPALGPKKAQLLHERLGISSIPELEEAIHAGRLEGLRGFGPKSEENILHGIALMREAGGRVLINAAMDLAEEITAELSELPGCVRCTWAGSLRRMRETIGDIDILVAAQRSGPFMDALTRLPVTAEVIAKGTKKTSIRTAQGIQVDLRVVPPDAWGAALLYFTGSKAHNIHLRNMAVKQGLKLSEYGLFEVESGEKIVSETEEEVYARFGLPWIHPALREDRGEIAAGLRDELPRLVTLEDLRGDLHTHTNLTDGVASLAEMTEAARRDHGYAYYAVTDHAPNLVMQRMTDRKILDQREEVRHLDGDGRRKNRMRLLHGAELNIAPDGSVDWPAEFLDGFDLCVASVHSHFQLSRRELTARVVRACENPYVSVIGHLTTRRIGKRAPIDADLDEIFGACARTGTVLEVNGQPDRLDLSDEHILRAKRYGVKFAIDSDAHSVPALGNIRYGLGTAQRGWLTPDDVINTWPLDRLRRLVAEQRGGSGTAGYWARK